VFSKYSKMNTLSKVKNAGRFSFGYNKYIEVCFDKIIYKRGFITTKYDINKIERIYLEELDTFVPVKYAGFQKINKATSNCIIISFKKEYKKRDILIEINGISDDVIMDFFNCFELSQDPIYYNYKKNTHLDTTRKLLIGLFILNILYLYMLVSSGEFINFDTYSLSDAYFIEDTSVYEELKQSGIMKKVYGNNILYIKIKDNVQLSNFKENVNYKNIKQIVQIEYNQKDDNEILYVFIGKTDRQKLYYKTSWNKIKTVLKKSNTYSLEETSVYCFTLDRKYNYCGISFIETR